MLYRLLKPFLFMMSAERAHYFTVKSFSTLLSIPLLSALIKRMLRFEHENLEKEVCSLRFKNPVGLAAGFDKNGEYIRIMEALGFGSIEVGTVTPKPQEGNPKPRLFRLRKDYGLINRMGFNNKGVDYLVDQLKKYRSRYPDSTLIIGGNIGKNKVTPNDKAHQDYLTCFEKLHAYVDYFTVNVSSPNTPNLRDLQQIEPLRHLLVQLQEANKQKAIQRPIFLKIAPDMHVDQLTDIVNLALEIELDGLIATNTTISREGLDSDASLVDEIGAGGLSGDPVRTASTSVVEQIGKISGGKFALIGVGGIRLPEHAREKMHAGADLIQVYSGMVYAGPFMVKKIKKNLF